MSETPRTDATTGWPVGQRGVIKTDFLQIEPGGELVPADFARTLERELAEFKAAKASWGRQIRELERELAEANNQIAMDTVRFREMQEAGLRLEVQLSALTQDKARHAADAACENLRKDLTAARARIAELERELEREQEARIEAAMRGQNQ